MNANGMSIPSQIVSIKDDRFGDSADKLFKGAVKLEIGEGITGWVAKNRESVMVEDAQEAPRFSKKAEKNDDLTLMEIWRDAAD